MTTNFLLSHLRPTTLAQLAAELIADHTDDIDANSYNFHTEAAAAAYRDLLAVGIANCGEDEFFTILDDALAAEWAAHSEALHS